MTRCLEDKTLFLLSEGDGGEEERSHLQSCQACAERYHKLEQDLRCITYTLQQESPPLRLGAPRTPLFYRSLPIAAGVLLAFALMWGESRFWRPNSAPEQTLNGDVSQFLEQVSEAIFDDGRIRDTENTSSASDLASLQVALGEDCSDECRELFDHSLVAVTSSKANSVDRPVVSAKKRPLDPTMQRMVADRAE